jgi:glyoxylate/hydroxypyruvate reductase
MALHLSQRPVLLCGGFDAGERARWLAALQSALPEVRWLDHPDAAAQAAAIEVAVVANPAPGSLQGLPKLRLVQSLWAGVDRLLADTSLPQHVPVARMVDPAMTAAMAQTVLWAVLSLHRGFFTYAQHQRQALWLPHRQRRADEVPVLILGQGEMGQAVALALRTQGYPVQTWRRDGQPLAPLLPSAQVVVNLLPLTPATQGLLNADFFATMAPGAALVNVARGAQLVEADLLLALNSGQLHHAVLDVFSVEPLPPAHPFWSHPKVTVLPHAAAATDERSAAAVVAHNLRALWAGAPIAHRVDRQRGY